MLPTWARFLAVLFCLCLCLQLSASNSLGLVPRQDEGNPDQAPEPTPTGDDDQKPTNDEDGNDNKDDEKSSSATATATQKDEDEDEDEETSSASSSASPTKTPSSDEDILEADKIPADQLPLQPRITPAFGVGGVLLIISGSVHLLVGNKTTWLQTFFSVGLLASLATTVLILYVMAPPVSDGIQGAYLVGIALGGIILGAGSTIFKELTEGLGCILGGFALGMWILTLIPGGLIPQDVPKAVFLALMAVCPFGLFFFRYTRDFALIGLVSFGGATAVVIGIDCFSCVGLKEFWAYIWNLNERLFPNGTTTYPVTKGMRVESGAIILLFLIGIVSQLKLWRLIRARRQQKADEEAEDERNLQEEEEAVGRAVEERTARDRRAWERAYGSPGSDDLEEDTTPKSGRSEAGYPGEKGTPIVKEISMAQSPHSSSATPEPALMTSGEGEGAKVMVRVVPDGFPPAPERVTSLDPEEQAWAQHGNRDPQSVVDSSEPGVLRSMATAPQPEVIPLPFRLNEVEEDDEAERRTVGARSSNVGTYADEDDLPQSRRSSLAHRFSQGSANLLRSLSQRTDKKLGQGGGLERLIARRSMARTDDERGSLVATVDIASVDDARSTLHGADGESIEMTADLAGVGEEISAQEVRQLSQAGQPNGEQAEDGSAAVGSEAPSDVPNQWKKSSVGNGEAAAGGSSASKRDASLATSSTPALLTRDSLPEPLSRTALKYRTNEWVKHSTTAEAPEPDEIHIYDSPEPDELVDEENAAPLNLDELQQTAMNGTPAPATSRSSTVMSNAPSRNASRSDLRLSTDPRNESTSRTLGRSPSGFFPNAIPEEPGHAPSVPSVLEDDRSSTRTSATTPVRTRRANSSPQGKVPFASSQTLMGKRETYLRNKPLGMQTPLNIGAAVDHPFPIQTPSESPENGRSRSRSQSPDDDDMPLSHRRALIRRGSTLSFGIPSAGTEKAFNSHQPQRAANSPHPAVREVQLANFRQSVQADLRAGTPGIYSSRRESTREMGPEAHRGMEMQRGAMLREKEEAQRAREAEKWGRERRERAFEEMVRSGELMGAHREAMKRLQEQAKEG